MTIEISDFRQEHLIDARLSQWHLNGIDNDEIVEHMRQRREGGHIWNEARYDDLSICSDPVPKSIQNLLAAALDLTSKLLGEPTWCESVWGQYRLDHEALPFHNHDGVDLAMAYYASAPEGCSDLRFIPWGIGPFISKGGWVGVKPEVGKIAIFPGWACHHTVAHKNKDEPRVVISANFNRVSNVDFVPPIRFTFEE